MSAARFDPTVNLGHLLTFGGFIIGGLAAFYSVKSELEHVGSRVQRVEVSVMRVEQLLVSGAKQEVEITELRRRLDKIETRGGG
jgi:hypothetical protein